LRRSPPRRLLLSPRRRAPRATALTWRARLSLRPSLPRSPRQSPRSLLRRPRRSPLTASKCPDTTSSTPTKQKKRAHQRQKTKKLFFEMDYTKVTKIPKNLKHWLASAGMYGCLVKEKQDTYARRWTQNTSTTSTLQPQKCSSLCTQPRFKPSGAAIEAARGRFYPAATAGTQ
jgi:hypothetical protein